MPSKRGPERSFHATLEGSEKGRVYIVLPFDPAKEWGPRPRYHITGSINGNRIRGAIDQFDRGYYLPLGPTYRRDAGLKPGDQVAVTLAPEGPQSEALAPDIVAALAADPEAKRFFDGLATFYRKGYLR